MGKEYLGEFEELVMLMIALLKEEAYGLAICDEIGERTGRAATIGAVHATVARLEKKGLVETHMGGSTHERGGRRKRLIKMTNTGKQALIRSKEVKVKLWADIPELAIGG